MDIEAAFGAKLIPQLADGFKEGQAFDIADGAADFADTEIFVGQIAFDKFLDRIGDMRNDLNRRAEIIAAAFLGDDRRINLAGGDVVGLAGGDASEAFVMAEIEIGFGAVIGDVDFAMLRRAHRARIDIEIGIELAEANFIPTRLQQRAEGRGSDAFAE